MAAATDSGVTAVKDQQAGQADSATTPCMPCSFGLLPRPRSGRGAQPSGLLGVTVTVRWRPLVTAGYGTLVARPTITRLHKLTPTGLGAQLRQAMGSRLFPTSTALGLNVDSSRNDLDVSKGRREDHAQS